MISLNKQEIDSLFSHVLLEQGQFDFLYLSNHIQDTKDLAFILAKYLKKKDIIILNGELGAGKTAFLTGIAQYFHIEDQISSPTFTIVNEYTIVNNCPLYHFDVYRLQDSDEFLEGIGTDYFEQGICMIEWGNIIQDILPSQTIHIDIQKDQEDENKRYFHLWRK